MSKILLRIKNICVNTKNNHLYTDIERKYKNTDILDVHERTSEVEDMISFIRANSIYSKEEINEALKNLGATSYKIVENGELCLTIDCRFKLKKYQIKMLYPTDKYVIGGGPWQVSPITINEHAYKEARKIATKLNISLPYKRVILEQ